VKKWSYHLLFWSVYQYIWWSVAVGSPLEAARLILFSPYSVKFLFYVVLQGSAVYFNLYWLMPRFLEKGRYAAYIIWTIATVFSVSMMIVPGYYLSALLAHKTFQQAFGEGNSSFYHLFTGNSLPSTLASMTLGMSVKLTIDWIQTRRRQQLLEKEKLESELKFLKYQFNPHFLFNTINSIFFLINQDPEKASASLAKFSELLRYQLYECNDTQIPLTKEIEYLENFIQLEKLRQNDDVNVSFKLEGEEIQRLGIAPFILMIFVENAFKHVSKQALDFNWIKIRLSVNQQRLSFFVANSCPVKAATDVVRYGGIGLNNVRRRLELIYPGRYELSVKNTGTTFEANLQMELSELVIFETSRNEEVELATY
jgi:two-component system LytT family sensor kinase